MPITNEVYGCSMKEDCIRRRGRTDDAPLREESIVDYVSRLSVPNLSYDNQLCCCKGRKVLAANRAAFMITYPDKYEAGLR